MEDETKRYSPIAYVRVTIRVGAPPKNRTVWAQKLPRSTAKLLYYSVVAKDGGKKDELLISVPEDVVAEIPARMNLFFGELETID